MDNIPVLKDGKANPDFLMTDEQAVAVLKVIRMGNMKSGGDILNKVISDHALNKAIKALERPRGEWIDEGIMADGHPHHAFRCSECESHIVRIPEETPNFCEYCGSKNGGDT